MVHIEDGLVEGIARRLAGEHPFEEEGRLPPRSAERLLREQPELLAFVLAGTASLAPECRSVGVFVADVIFEAFRVAGRATRSLAADAFVQALRRNREMAVRLGRAHEKFAERYLRNSRVLRQPALIRFVTGVLLEQKEACPHRIAREELGPLFMVLKSIIDVLDRDVYEEASLAPA